MMKYILYARKSSESEDRQVQSLGDQFRTLRELAKNQGLTVIDELHEARSAKDPKSRPLFETMLDRIERGEADAILCWSINRLTRNPVDAGRISWLLQQGVLKCIRSIDREYLPEDNALLMAVESGVATQYILDLRKAVIRGMEGKAARGWFPCKPPQGYTVNHQTKQVEPKEPQFEMLRRAWELLLTGAYPVAKIRRELMNWGYTVGKQPADRQLFSESHLYRIFDNEFYAGSFMYRGQRYQGKHQAMVTVEEFERAQRLLHGQPRVQPKKHEFAFTGMMRCGTCGCQITAERKVKNYRTVGRTVVYEYYRCTRRRGPCPEPAVTSVYIETAITDRLRSVSINAGFATWLINLLERDWTEEEPKDLAIEGEQVATDTELESKAERLLEMRLSGELNKDEFLRHRNQLEERRARIRSSAERDRAQKLALANAVRFASDALRQFRREDIRIKRQIAKTFASSYVLTQGELRIIPHALLSRIVTLEPRQTSSHKVGAAAPCDKPPPEWSQGEHIRTLSTALRSFTVEELSPFIHFRWVDKGKGATLN